MFIRWLRLVRASFQLAWLVATLSLVGLVSLTHVLPAFGRELYVVRGASMEPAIPIGSAVIVRHVAPGQLSAGDVITFRGANGSVVTHRILALPGVPGQPIQTKGDASDAPDPFGVSPGAVIGSVELVLPAAGSVLATLGSTAGAVATIALLGGLLIAVWFMDELLANVRRAITPEPRAAESAG